MANDPLDWLGKAEEEDKQDLVRALAPLERDDFEYNWPLWARPSQLAPAGDWRVWLVMAGRGFGKTRAGAEWVRQVAEDPGARIALVAATLAEARAVMVEGESGVLAVHPPHRAPRFEPSLRRVVWDNGAQALLYSAGEAEGLRGPQHSHARWAGAEGGYGQRGSCRSRLHPARLDRGRERSAPGRSGARPGVDRGNKSERRVERPQWAGRRMDRVGMAVRQPGARNALVRSRYGSLPAL